MAIYVISWNYMQILQECQVGEKNQKIKQIKKKMSGDFFKYPKILQQPFHN